MVQKIDPIHTEIMSKRLNAICDEMAVRIVRTARSVQTKEGLDFSTALFSPRGQLTAQGFCIPFQLGAVPGVMPAVLKRLGGNMYPGDIIVLNDPYSGGGHLPDVILIKPLYRTDKLVGFASVYSHQVDIGGRVPGGNAADSTEIFQEGLRIPPVKLFERNQLNFTMYEMFRCNVRMFEEVWGDLLALKAACEYAEREFMDLLNTIPEADDLIESVLLYSERLVRGEIAKLPDGAYEFTDYIDNDGLGSEPIVIKARIEVKGDRILVDFTGTSKQARSAINSGASMTKSAVYTCLKCIMSADIPVNQGFLDAIDFRIPEGSILNAKFPAAVSGRGVLPYRVLDAVFGALHEAIPGRIPAAGEGGVSGISLGGTRDDGSPFVFVEFVFGAWGGRPDRDGIDGISPIGANGRNIPIEIAETYYPLRFLECGLKADTEGVGKWRGGLSRSYSFMLLEGDGVLSTRTDRELYAPYGLDEGESGTPCSFYLVQNGERRRIGTKVTLPMPRGSVLEFIQASGGGFGNRRERNRDLILEDILDEKLSREGAKEKYGVIFTDGEIREYFQTKYR